MFWLGMLLGAVVTWFLVELKHLKQLQELRQLTLEAIEQMHAEQRAEYDRRFREMP